MDVRALRLRPSAALVAISFTKIGRLYQVVQRAKSASAYINDSQQNFARRI